MKVIKKYEELIITVSITSICFALLFISLKFGSKELAAAVAVFVFPPLMTFLMAYLANGAADDIVERTMKEQNNKKEDKS